MHLARRFTPRLTRLFFALVFITGRRRGHVDIHIAQQLAQLAEGVVPFAHAQVVDVVLAAPAAQLIT